MKIIAPRLHGFIDYILVVFLLLSPTLFGMTGLLANLTYALGAIHLLLTVFTGFSLGVIKVVPFPIHGLIELVVGIALIVCAFTLFRMHTLGHFFYAGLGIAVLLVWILTDYNKKD
ncbi:MAG: hypothetical protein ABI390_09965 [Daejeonella sp.]